MIRKVQAFTVMELVVASIVSGIVIGILYMSYAIFQNQYKKNMQKGEVISELLLVHKAVQTDFDSAIMVTEPINNKLRCDFADGSTANYHFDSKVVVREKLLNLDTFNVILIDTKVQYVNESEKVVEQLALRFRVEEEALNIVFLKSYTAKELISIK